MTFQIAIDGPAGAGKSTMAKILSKKYGAIYLDTGAMYRTVGLKAVKMKVDTKDENAINNIIKDINIKIAFANGAQVIYLDEEDVTSQIRTPQISIATSNVAIFTNVRLKMVKMQREIAADNNVVMDGRDIGTYVLPNAQYKFYLVADVRERAKRRVLELKEQNINADIEKIVEDMKYRDENDSNRAFAPLSQAKDAILIDTTNLNITQVIDVMIGYINEK